MMTITLAIAILLLVGLTFFAVMNDESDKINNSLLPPQPPEPEPLYPKHITITQALAKIKAAGMTVSNKSTIDYELVRADGGISVDINGFSTGIYKYNDVSRLYYGKNVLADSLTIGNNLLLAAYSNYSLGQKIKATLEKDDDEEENKADENKADSDSSPKTNPPCNKQINT